MNAQQHRELTRALEIAHEHQLYILGVGTRKSDGAMTWAVSSHSDANLFHLVCLVGSSLECDCYWSSQRHRICAHRSLVHQALVEAQQLVSKNGKEPPSPAPATPAPTLTDSNTVIFVHI